MKRLALSTAAAGLLRALLARAGEDRDRIFLIEARSVDWQSLTCTGERHCLSLRLAGADAEGAWRRLVDGLDDAELPVRGHVVADICARAPDRSSDGTLVVRIEALTVSD